MGTRICEHLKWCTNRCTHLQALCFICRSCNTHHLETTLRLISLHPVLVSDKWAEQDFKVQVSLSEINDLLCEQPFHYGSYNFQEPISVLCILFCSHLSEDEALYELKWIIELLVGFHPLSCNYLYHLWNVLVLFAIIKANTC